MQRSVREHKMTLKGEKCVLGILRNFLSSTISVLLLNTRNIVERQAMQRVDESDKTGSDDVSNENLGAKSVGDRSIVKRGAPQLDVQELELEQQPASQELVQETQGALSERKQGM